jgi:hypothetical protein
MHRAELLAASKRNKNELEAHMEDQQCLAHPTVPVLRKPMFPMEVTRRRTCSAPPIAAQPQLLERRQYQQGHGVPASPMLTLLGQKVDTAM